MAIKFTDIMEWVELKVVDGRIQSAFYEMEIESRIGRTKRELEFTLRPTEEYVHGQSGGHAVGDDIGDLQASDPLSRVVVRYSGGADE